MTITFVCRSSKVSKKDGLTPLELYVIINGKRRFVSLNRRIVPKLFNPKKQIVSGNDQGRSMRATGTCDIWLCSYGIYLNNCFRYRSGVVPVCCLKK